MFTSKESRGYKVTPMDGMSSLKTINHEAKKGYFRMGYKRQITDLKRDTYGWEVQFANNKSRG